MTNWFYNLVEMITRNTTGIYNKYMTLEEFTMYVFTYDYYTKVVNTVIGMIIGVAMIIIVSIVSGKTYLSYTK